MAGVHNKGGWRRSDDEPELDRRVAVKVTEQEYKDLHLLKDLPQYRGHRGHKSASSIVRGLIKEFLEEHEETLKQLRKIEEERQKVLQ